MTLSPAKPTCKNVRGLAADILHRVLETDAYSDILIEQTFLKQTLSTRDKALLTEMVHGTLRWLGRLEFICQHTYHGKWHKVPRNIRVILFLAVYQLIFLKKIPDYAAINEAVNQSKKHEPHWARVVNGMLRHVARQRNLIIFPDMDTSPVDSIAAEWSHPQWLVKYWIDQFGVKRTRSLCQANNRRPAVTIRLNRLFPEYSRVLPQLKAFAPEPSEYLDDFFRLGHARNLSEHPLHQKGAFTIQDESAGLAVRLMDPAPDDLIVDLAAAPGGKSTFMAELASDRAVILSCDLSSHRMRRLLQNVSRLNLKHLYCMQADANCPAVRSADKVLLDAPCSGIGVLRKRSELRWRMDLEQVKALAALQKGLLKAASGLVRPGGILVYSTCTTMFAENRDVVLDFLNKNHDFRVDDPQSLVTESVITSDRWIETWPDLHGTDGSFAVRLKRTEENG